MNKRLLTLAGRIRQELSEVRQVVDRAAGGWERAKQTGDDFYLDGVALNLHGFYSALERIFESIAADVDQSKPEGENWHQALLRQMSADIGLVRPPVISHELRDSLDEYRGFRHVVRNVYAFHLSPAKMAQLVEKLPGVFDRLSAEVNTFLAFIETRGGEKA